MPQPTQQQTPTPSETSRIEQLLEENLALTKQIYEDAQKTRKYILFGQVVNVIKIVVIIGPIILAFIYLPQLLGNVLGTYNELLGGGTSQTLLEGNSFLKGYFPQE